MCDYRMYDVGITTPKFKSHVSNHQSQNLGRKFIVFTCFWPIVKILLRKKVTASQSWPKIRHILLGFSIERCPEFLSRGLMKTWSLKSKRIPTPSTGPSSKRGDWSSVAYPTLQTYILRVCLWSGKDPYAEVYTNVHQSGIMIPNFNDPSFIRPLDKNLGHQPYINFV